MTDLRTALYEMALILVAGLTIGWATAHFAIWLSPLMIALSTPEAVIAVMDERTSI